MGKTFQENREHAGLVKDLKELHINNITTLEAINKLGEMMGKLVW